MSRDTTGKASAGVEDERRGDDRQRERLKDAIARGYDDMAADRVVVLDDEEQIDAFFRDL